MRKEKTEEQVNKEAKRGLRFAAGAVRITGDSASSEDRKRTSGGVFVGFEGKIWESQPMMEESPKYR